MVSSYFKVFDLSLVKSFSYKFPVPIDMVVVKDRSGEEAVHFMTVVFVVAVEVFSY